MAAEFLGTFAAFNVNGTIMLLDAAECDAIDKAYAPRKPDGTWQGKINAIKKVRDLKMTSLKDAKDLVECFIAIKK